MPLLLLSLLCAGPDLAAIGAEDYLTREAASKRLSQRAWLCWRACDWYSRVARDRESRVRAGRVARYGTCMEPTPLILALPGAEAVRWRWYGADGAGGWGLGGFTIHSRWIWLCGPRHSDGEYTLEALRRRTAELCRLALLAGAPRGWIDRALEYLRQRECLLH